jgi:hypothetical protein
MTSDNAALPENPAASDIPPSSGQPPSSFSDASNHGGPDEDGAPSDDFRRNIVEPSDYFGVGNLDPSFDPTVGKPLPYESDPNSLLDPRQSSEVMERLTQEALFRSFQQHPTNAIAFDVSTCTSIRDDAKIVADGEYTFSINRALFQKAITAGRVAVGATTSGKANESVCVRICLSQFYLKLRFFVSAEVFFETEVSTKYVVLGLANDQTIAFLFDLHWLNELTRAVDADETLTAVYSAKRNRLIVRSELTSQSKFRVILNTYSHNEFGSLWNEALNNLTHIDHFDAAMLARGLKFAQLFAKQDLCSPTLAVASVRDGRISAGTYDALGVFTSPRLRSCNVDIKYHLLSRITKCLVNFSDSEPHLFEAKHHHVMYDGYRVLAFAKSNLSSPNTSAFDAIPAISEIFLSREILRKELKALALAENKRNPDALMTLRVSGLEQTPTYLFANDISRGHAVGKVESIRRPKLGWNKKLADFNYARECRVLGYFLAARDVRS